MVYPNIECKTDLTLTLVIWHIKYFSHFRYLLGKHGFDYLDPFVPVNVPIYSQKELISCLDYFRERLWIPQEPELNEELSFLSANNPYRLMNLTAGL